nr:hypothetical protein [Aquicoccus sp. G2-2]MEA1112987.1 hypothetical protein [Aquicoccus sp. G2-2]
MDRTVVTDHHELIGGSDQVITPAFHLVKEPLLADFAFDSVN